MSQQEKSGRGVAFGLGLIVVLVLLTGGLSYQSLRRLDRDAAWVIHTQEVLDALAEIRVTYADAASHQRAYLLTGDRRFLGAFTDAGASVAPKIERVGALTVDNPRQQDRMPALRRLAAARAGDLDRALALGEAQGPEAARRFLRSAGSADSDLLPLLSAMEAEERRLLAERRGENRSNYAAAVVTTLSTAVLALAGVGLFAAQLRQHLRSRNRAAAIIGEQRRFLQATLAGIGDGVIATDARGRVTFLNPVAEALTSWHDAAARDRPLAEVFRIVNEETRAEVENPALRALAAGHIVGLANHTVLISRDGTERAIDDSASPIRGEGGEVSGAVLVFRDVTERRRVEKAVLRRSAQLQGLAGMATHLNVAHDVGSILGLITEGAREIVGAHQAITHQAALPPASHAVSLSDKYAEWRARDLRPEGMALHTETCQANRALRLSEAELAARLAAAGGPPEACPPPRGWLAAPLTGLDGRNVGLIQLSDRDEGDFTADDEAVLVQLAQMASVALENARLYGQLREADRLKDEFLATLAHELRNPLAPVRNSLEVLKSTASDSGLAERARATMERQVGQMVRLIDDLLDVSRITRNKLALRRERVELAAVVASGLETSRPLIEAGRHLLAVSLPAEPLLLDADPTRLAQVLSNLLNNSAKYTEPGGRIELTAEREGGEAVVRVRDNGIGIPPEMLPRIFDPFTQIDRSLERVQGGLGIGLTLVRRLVEMHGGRVEAHSAGLGQGSELTVRLPLASPVSASAAPPAESGKSWTDEASPTAPQAPAFAPLVGVEARRIPMRRILVVDDNRDSAESLALLLTLGGHEVSVAHDGVEAIAKAAEIEPDVILLDIGMPRMSGYEVAAKIRQQSGGRRVTLVAVTGWGQESDRRRSAESGFDHHLVKPVDHDALKALLASLAPPEPRDPPEPREPREPSAP